MKSRIATCKIRRLQTVMDWLRDILFLIIILERKLFLIIISGVQISFRCFLSKIMHLLWKNGILCFIRSIVHRIVLLAFGTNLELPSFQFRVFVHFRPFATFFVFDVKFTALKFSKPLTTTSFTSGERTICFYKQSMRPSCRFLQIGELNQKSPQMTLIWLKMRHFHTQKNILCW